MSPSTSRSKLWSYFRTQSGSLNLMLMLGIFLAIFMISSMGVDISHNVTTHTSLQNAADAAALAGAAALVANNTQSSISSAAYSSAQSGSAAVAATNQSDGRAVSDNTSGCQVATNLIDPGPPNAGQTCPSNNGQCQISASMAIKNLFAAAFGHYTDNVNAQATATAYSTMTSINGNMVFPIAVSLDTVNGHMGTPDDQDLYMASIGSQETFTLSEPCANAAWTSLNTRNTNGAYLSSAVQSSLGTSYQPGVVPPQTVAESGGIDLLADIKTAPDLSSGAINKALIGQTIVLPVMAGDPPYRSVSSGTQYAPVPQWRPLLGFIGLKVSGVTIANGALQTISGTLVKALVKGQPGIANPVITASNAVKNAQLDSALQNLSPGMVQLASTNLTNVNVPPANQTDTFSANSSATGGGAGGTLDDTSGTTVNSVPNYIQTLLSDNGLARETKMLGEGDLGYSTLTEPPGQSFTLEALYHDEWPISTTKPPTCQILSADGKTVLANVPVTQQNLPSGSVPIQGDSQYETLLQVQVPAQPAGSFLIMITAHDGDHTNDEGRHIWLVTNPACPG